MNLPSAAQRDLQKALSRNEQKPQTMSTSTASPNAVAEEVAVPGTITGQAFKAIERQGYGSETPPPLAKLVLHCTASYVDEGARTPTVFSNSRQSGRFFEFQLGSTGAPPTTEEVERGILLVHGFKEGIATMRKGERATIRCLPAPNEQAGTTTTTKNPSAPFSSFTSFLCVPPSAAAVLFDIELMDWDEEEEVADDDPAGAADDRGLEHYLKQWWYRDGPWKKVLVGGINDEDAAVFATKLETVRSATHFTISLILQSQLQRGGRLLALNGRLSQDVVSTALSQHRMLQFLSAMKEYSLSHKDHDWPEVTDAVAFGERILLLEMIKHLHTSWNVTGGYKGSGWQPSYVHLRIITLRTFRDGLLQQEPQLCAELFAHHLAQAEVHLALRPPPPSSQGEETATTTAMKNSSACTGSGGVLDATAALGHLQLAGAVASSLRDHWQVLSLLLRFVCNDTTAFLPAFEIPCKAIATATAKDIRSTAALLLKEQREASEQGDAHVVAPAAADPASMSWLFACHSLCIDGTLTHTNPWHPTSISTSVQHLKYTDLFRFPKSMPACIAKVLSLVPHHQWSSFKPPARVLSNLLQVRFPIFDTENNEQRPSYGQFPQMSPVGDMIEDIENATIQHLVNFVATARLDAGARWGLKPLCIVDRCIQQQSMVAMQLLHWRLLGLPTGEVDSSTGARKTMCVDIVRVIIGFCFGTLRPRRNFFRNLKMTSVKGV